MASEKADVAAGTLRSIGSKVVLISAGALAAMLLALLLLCQVAGVRSTSDVIAYRAMWREHYHPIWKDLALRRIKKSDTVESVLLRRPAAQREDAGLYTSLAYFTRGLGPRDVILIAKDGKLIAAKASGNRCQHLFFDSPEQGETFGQAHMKFRQQKKLETGAYTIHHAIATGRNVFLSDHVERHQVPGPSPENKKIMAQLKEIYGARYLRSMPGITTHEELAVEVTEVLSGMLAPGTILTFPKDKCDDDDLDEPETVFVSTQTQGEASYLTTSRSTLEWYQSLTPEQIQEIEARWSGKRARTKNQR